MREFLFTLCVAVSLLSCGRLNAQSTFGSIVGSVWDPSGAVVPGATVSARDLDENVTRPVESNEQGLYQILNLKPGRYEITAVKTGFATFKIAEAVLTARQILRADVNFTVAAISEAVVVRETPPPINTENATISDTKNFEQITQLPVNFRGATTSPLAAILTVPGVQQDPGGNFSIGGGLPAMNEFTVDGISTASVRRNGPLVNMYPSSELLDEFKVTSINNNAEFAQMGDVTVSTKGGTNQWHGSGFWYHQNRALDATVYGSRTKQAKVFNTFGGSFSGPVQFPGVYHGRNRTFFFADYEGNRRPGSRLQILDLPTADMRAGKLAGVPGGAAVDPLTGLPFPNNEIPASRINPVPRVLLEKYYPLPNFGSGPSTFANFRRLVSTPAETNQYDTRIDHFISSRQQIYARWSWKKMPSIGVNGLMPDSTFADFNRNLILSHNVTLNPRLINEFRFGFSVWENTEKFPINGARAVAELGIQGLDTSKHPDTGAFPGFDFSDGTDFMSIGKRKDGFTKSRTYQFTDNLSWIRGRHTMKFGLDIRKVGMNAAVYWSGSDDFGDFEFWSKAFSGNAYADFLLGIPAYTQYTTTGPDTDVRAFHYRFYGQDEWKVSSRLTLNFGLRWQLHPPFRERAGDMMNYDRTTGALIIPDQTLPPTPGFLYTSNACPGVEPKNPCTKILRASEFGIGQGLRRTYYGNYAPRVSFAWRPFHDNNTVIRAGFGMYTLTLLGPKAYQLVGIHSADNRRFFNYQGPGKPAQFVLPRAYGGDFEKDAPGSSWIFWLSDLTYRDPYTSQWSFTLERALPRGFTARATYLGAAVVGLTGGVDLNQVPASTAPYSPSRRPNPNFQAILTADNLGFASYQAMQLEASRRFSGGLFFQSSYVLAKHLGNANTYGAGFAGETGSRVTDRFNTRLDRGQIGGTPRHRFLLTSIYQLPFGTGRRFGKSMHPLVNAVLGGWELSTVTLLQTGPYVTPSMSTRLDQSNTDVSGRAVGARPDRIGNGNLPNPTPDRWWDIGAFVATPAGAGRFGNAGVGILQGPGTVAVAGGLAKTFPIHERLRLRCEATFTNLPNHPNFAVPGSNFSSPASFGRTVRVQSAENSGNRVGQIALRLDF